MKLFVLLWNIQVILTISSLDENCQPYGFRLFLGHYYSILNNYGDAIRVVFNTKDQCDKQFTLLVDNQKIEIYDTKLLNMTDIYKDTNASIIYETFIHTFKINKLEQSLFTYTLQWKNDIVIQQKVKMPTLDQENTKVLFFGDMDSSQVMNRSKATFDWFENSTEQYYDSILFTGDMAYDLESESCMRGELWLNNISLFTQKYPFMVTPGNHDCGQNYHYDFLRAHFQMLYLSEYDTPLYNNDFYSFDIGLIHFIQYDPMMLVYNADEKNNTKEKLLQQFQHDLELAQQKRNKIPWIIVFSHYPIYCNYMQDDQCVHNFQYLKDFEKLFQDYNVDLYISGHQHNYQRNQPYYQNLSVKYDFDGQTFSNYNNPISIIEGAGGADYGPEMMIYDTQPYTMFQDAGNGIGLLEVHNKTHLQYKHIKAQTNQVVDTFWIVKIENNENNSNFFTIEIIIIIVLIVIIMIMSIFGLYYIRKLKNQKYTKAIDINV